MVAPRAVVIALWIFCVNGMFAVFNAIDPFNFHMTFLGDMAIINATAQASSVTSVTGFGIAEAVMIFNLAISVLLGPVTMVPAILNLIGVHGVLAWLMIGTVWIIWIIFILQIITGRTLRSIE